MATPRDSLTYTYAGNEFTDTPDTPKCDGLPRKSLPELTETAANVTAQALQWPPALPTQHHLHP